MIQNAQLRNRVTGFTDFGARSRHHPGGVSEQPRRMMEMRSRLIPTVMLLGLTIGYGVEAEAACNATVNGRPMSPQDCMMARQIYGSVAPGHYVADQRGNWSNLSNGTSGNIYRDAQRGGGSGSYGGGMTSTPFGSVGGGYYFDPETGASVGPN
jgi:hypothetical protein